MKKLICLLLSAVLLVTAAALPAAANGDIDIDVSDIEGAQEMKTYSIADLAGKYKTQGRGSVENGVLMLNWSAASFEFNAHCTGDVAVEFNVKTNHADGCWFSVYINGEKQPREACYLQGTGTKNVTLAANLPEGNYSFKVVKQNEAGYATVGVKSIRLNGEFLAPPVQKQLYLEFIGDSITTGIGNLGTPEQGGNANSSKWQDATSGYAFLTANALNADYSLVAQMGIGASVGYQAHIMSDIYPYTAKLNGNSAAYSFARQPDVVVLGLGTNDFNTYQSKGFTLTQVQQGFAKTLQMVREKNPKAKIVWIYNMMTGGLNEQIKTVIAQAGGAEKGYYSVQLTRGNSGWNGHSSAAQHQVLASELTAFLKSEVLAKTLGDADGDGSVTLKDAYEVARFAAGQDSGLLICNADAFADDRIDLKDTVEIVRKVLN